MSIAVVCSKCSAKLNAPDGAAGKKVKCPKCQTALVVPDAVASQFEVVEDEPPAVTRPAGKPARVKAAADDDDDDRPRRKRGSQEDEDNEDRPRKKKRKNGGDKEGGVSMTRNIVMGAVLIILIAVAGYIFYERSKEKDEKSTSITRTTMIVPKLL
jgi:LSD1 subclass zinc finger protein